MIDIIAEFVTNYTFRTVMLGSILVCFIIGSIGTFAVLREQSLLGDTIAHATFPGIVLFFLLTLSKDPVIIMVGALFSGLLSAILVHILTEYTKLKSDAVLGIILSISFGIGLVLLSILQNMNLSHQSGLNNFLFGNAATIVEEQVILFLIIGLILFFLIFLYWKEIKLVSFNPEYAQVIGLPLKTINLMINLLIVIAIVLGLQSVGVILISALVVAPMSASRQWSNTLWVVFILSGVFGGLAGLIGAIISSSYTQMPTGPVIVVVLSFFVFVSLFFAPARGILYSKLKNKTGE